MDLLRPIALIVAGILAASGFIIARKPDAKQLIDKLVPFQGFIGVALLAWGVIDLLRVLGHLKEIGLIADHILVLTIFMVSACTFQVDILDAPQPSEVVLTTPTTSPTILIPSSSATPPPFPTDSSTPLPPNTPVLATFPSVAALPVVFSANGTFQDIAGNVGTGSKQTYSLNAFQGQIMSVSILPEQAGLHDTFQLEIKGRDGVVLCPIQGAACPFWRGALPSTQEYLITVNPQEGGAYTMRIAINPAGTVS